MFVLRALNHDQHASKYIYNFSGNLLYSNTLQFTSFFSDRTETSQRLTFRDLRFLQVTYLLGRNFDLVYTLLWYCSTGSILSPLDVTFQPHEVK